MSRPPNKYMAGKYYTSDGRLHQDKEKAEAHELSLRLQAIISNHYPFPDRLTYQEICALFSQHHDEVRHAIRVCKGER